MTNPGHSKPRNRSVLIFAKPPRMGLAKTRLARSLGSGTEAQRINRYCAQRTFAAALDPRWETTLYAAPDRHLHDTLGGAWPSHVERRSQGKGDLGQRLTKGLKESARGEVVFIGTDAPDITGHLIWTAFRMLRGHDAVIGPATDGGFWLLGLSVCAQSLGIFENIRWSHAETMNDLVSNFGGGRIHYLPTLIDIDEAEDWGEWRASTRSR